MGLLRGGTTRSFRALSSLFSTLGGANISNGIVKAHPGQGEMPRTESCVLSAFYLATRRRTRTSSKWFVEWWRRRATATARNQGQGAGAREQEQDKGHRRSCLQGARAGVSQAFPPASIRCEARRPDRSPRSAILAAPVGWHPPSHRPGNSKSRFEEEGGVAGFSGIVLIHPRQEKRWRKGSGEAERRRGGGR